MYFYVKRNSLDSLDIFMFGWKILLVILQRYSSTVRDIRYCLKRESPHTAISVLNFQFNCAVIKENKKNSFSDKNMNNEFSDPSSEGKREYNWYNLFYYLYFS